MEWHSHANSSFGSYIWGKKVAKQRFGLHYLGKQNVKDSALGNRVMLEVFFIQIGYLEK